MAYTITLTDGTVFATIPDGTLNTASSLVLLGKNYAGYGEFVAQNFIRDLENSACNATTGTSFQPTQINSPITGQIWYNKTNGVMCVYNGSVWKNVSAVRASATQPTQNVAGDLWFDTTDQQLKVHNGVSYLLVGPPASASQGTSGAVVATVQDTIGTPGGHVVVLLYSDNDVVATISRDAAFTPSPAIPGFATINPGVQLSTAITNNFFRGTATNAQLLDSLDSEQFLRSDANDSTTGTLSILNDVGLRVGVGQDAVLSVNPVDNEVRLSNQTNSADLALQVNVSGSNTIVMRADGSTGTVTFPAGIVAVPSGVVTATTFVGNVLGNVDGTVTAPGANTQVLFNNSGVIGASTNFTANAGTGAFTAAGTIAGGNLSTSGTVGVGGALTVNTAGAAATAIASGAANATGNIGSSTNSFNTVFANTFQGTATQAITATTAGSVSGTVAIANGGTGQTTRDAALNALLPAQDGSVANYFLRTDGAGLVTWEAAATGGVANVASGGTGRSTLTANNVLIGNGTDPVNLVAPGNVGNVLTSTGTSWTTSLGGNVNGSGSSTDFYVARFNGISGRGIADSAGTDVLMANGIRIGRGGGGVNVGPPGTGSASNLVVGQSNALASLTTGADNVAIGVTSLLYLTTGSNNTGVGPLVMAGLTTGSDNTALGDRALIGELGTAGSSGLFTGSGNTGIGKLAGARINTGVDNTFCGKNSGIDLTSGNYNAFYGAITGYTVDTGTYNTALGSYSMISGSNTTNSTCVGSFSAVSGDNQVQLGDSQTTTYVYGSVQNRSDQRDKTDIRDTELGLSFITALRPRDFRWDMREDYRTDPPRVEDFEDIEQFRQALSTWKANSNLTVIEHDGTHRRTRYHHGLIAQEVKSVMDTMGVDFGGYQDHTVKDGSDVLSIGYTELIAPMIRAIQELTDRLAAAEAEIDRLKNS